MLGFPCNHFGFLLLVILWRYGEGLSLFSSLFSERFNIDPHNFVSLSGLKAFRLQKTQLRACISSIQFGCNCGTDNVPDPSSVRL